jgi:type I restriction enzyme S subunit
MAGIQLGNPAAFEFIGGLWKGERPPLQRARVLRSTNFRGDGLLDFTDVAELEVESRHFDERQLHTGDIVIERSGGGPKQPVGRAALFIAPDNQTYFTSNFTTALRVKDRSRLDPRFVALFLHALYLNGATETLQRATTGIRNLDWREFLRLEIPEIPVDDQARIAEIIGRVRTAYRIEDDLIATGRELKRAAMRELFTRGLRGEPQKESEIGPVPESWTVTTFRDVREWLQYGTSNRCSPERGTYPVLRIPNIGSGRVNTADLKYCDLPEEEAEKYRLLDGDLLFIRTNGVLERLGSCAVYKGQPNHALFASYLIRARLKSFVDPQFVAYFFGSDRGTELVASRATPAADGKYNLNTGTIDSLPLPVPANRGEQRAVVAMLDAIDRKIELHQHKRALLDELFVTVLHKLVGGEIRVADLDLSALDGPDDTSEQDHDKEQRTEHEPKSSGQGAPVA